jgi:hypothetical protein
MSETVLKHPLVREYLRVLHESSLTLPARQARELREQIAAHLDEALPPGATDDEVLEELGRLGSAHSLAAAAAGPGRQPFSRLLRNLLGHVRWWVWAVVALLVAVAGTGAGFLVSMRTAYPLTVISSGWLFPVDRDSATSQTAANITQTTVSPRYGQRQGIGLQIVNNSDWTQVILGVDPRWNLIAFSDIQVDVESGPHLSQVGEPLATAQYRSPGVIPPHSIRFVHLSWITNICPSSTGESITTDVWLRVRIGLITRTEDVSTVQAFALTGGPMGPCR